MHDPTTIAEGETLADLRGYRCPLPVLKTRIRLRGLSAGERLVVLTDDPLAGLDLPAFCNEAGQTIIDQQPLDGDAIRFTIERGENRL